jgi:hypothetical protein
MVSMEVKKKLRRLLSRPSSSELNCNPERTLPAGMKGRREPKQIVAV